MSSHLVESDPIDPKNPKFLKPYIDGIEVTQGIQYYKADQHLTDPNDRNKDNSVILVANKPAWVRVYVHDLSSSGRSVTGELEVDRNWKFPPEWEQVVLRPVAPSTIPTLENFDYVTERSNILATLNFVIPQKLMSYNIRLRAKIWLQEEGNRNNPDDTQSVFLNVMIRQTLRLRGILISYSGLDPNSATIPPPTINLDAPTIADLQTTAAWTMTTNPVQSQGVFSSAGTMEWNTPLTGTPTEDGGCSLEWIDLTIAAAQIKMNDGNRTDVIYYGLLPRGTPTGIVGGCALNGVSNGLNGDQILMAHEVGHAADLDHGPCGTTNVDAKYPAYEPYDPPGKPTASLGEYGLEINNGNIHLPTAKDYMSYCFQEWISLYHQARLTNNPVFDPQQLKLSKADIPGLVDPYRWPWEENPQWWETIHGGIKIRPKRIISIIGIYNKERQIEVQSVMRMFALPTVIDAIETDFVASLHGDGGEILAQAPLMRLKSHGHGCGCCNDEENSRTYNRPFAFQALVSDIEPGSALRIVKKSIDDNEEGHDKEVWSRSAPEQSSKITNFYVDLGGEKGVAEWDGDFSSPYGVKFSLQFSKDEGRSWNSLAVNVDKNRYEFDLKVIPVGLVVFRLLAHDGFFTNQKDSKYLEIKNYQLEVSILHPQESSKLVSGMPMRLWAAVNTTTIPNLKINKYVWKIDGEELGQDNEQDIETWITAPSPGTHVCEITVEDEKFKSFVATTKFTTID